MSQLQASMYEAVISKSGLGAAGVAGCPWAGAPYCPRAMAATKHKEIVSQNSRRIFLSLCDPIGFDSPCRVRWILSRVPLVRKRRRTRRTREGRRAAGELGARGAEQQRDAHFVGIVRAEAFEVVDVGHIHPARAEAGV